MSSDSNNFAPSRAEPWFQAVLDGTLSLQALSEAIEDTAAKRKAFPTFTVGWRAQASPDQPVVTTEPEDLLEVASDPDVQLRLAHCNLQFYRIQFRFAELIRRSIAFEVYFPRDPLIQAMRAFGELGLDPENKTAVEAIKGSRESAPRDVQVVLVVVLGLRANLYEHAEYIVRACDEVFPTLSPEEICAKLSVSGPTLQFHRSQALRALAEQAQDQVEALDLIRQAEVSIAAALEGLKPSGEADVLQDFVRERETVLDSRARLRRRWSDRERLESETNGALGQLETQVDEARRSIEGSLVKIVEILGIFAAFLVFIIGGGSQALSAAGGDLTWGEVGKRAVLLGVVAVGSVGFVFAIRFATRLNWRR